MSGTDDQFGDSDSDSSYPRAPLPPHERQWRHPAEIAASQTVAIKPASPRAKALAFVAATASMATTVVFAQILRPVERGQEMSTTTSAVQAPAEAQMPSAPGVFKINGVSFTAVAVGTASNRQFLVSAKEAAVSPSIRLEDNSATLTLSGIDDSLGLAIWSTPVDLAAASQSKSNLIEVNDPITVWDGHAYSGSIGVSTTRNSQLGADLVPLDIPSAVHAGSPVYSADGTLIGIVTVTDHARLMLPISSIEQNVAAIGTIGAIVDALNFAPLHRHDGVQVGYIIGESQFQPGDIITKVGDTAITTLLSLATAIKTVSGGSAVFTVTRGGDQIISTVALP